MSQHLVSRIDEFVTLVQAYEAKPRAKSLDTRRSLELFRDLTSGFELLARDSAGASLVDRRLEQYLKSPQIKETRLLFPLLQLLTTSFHFTAGIASGAETAYAYASSSEMRGSVRVDGPFFRDVLVPQLLDAVHLDLTISARLEILCLFARFENDNMGPPIFDDSTADGPMNALPNSHFVLGLLRRWEESGRRNLARESGRIENKLFRSKKLLQMAREVRLFRELLGVKGLDYLPRESFLRRLYRFFAAIGLYLRTLVGDTPGVLGGLRVPLTYFAGVALLALVVAFGLWIRFDHARMLERYDALLSEKGVVIEDVEKSE